MSGNGHILDQLKVYATKGVLRSIDWQFARWIGEVSGDNCHLVMLAAALASWRLSQGDVCVDLSQYASKPIWSEDTENTESDTIMGPKLETWIRTLEESPAVTCCRNGNNGLEEWQAFDALRPLVLDGYHLYLARYWAYEVELARRILRLARGWMEVSPEQIRQDLDRLFPGMPGDGVDWQKIAAAVAAMKRFCIISGGPGTGKTYTVTAILALLFSQSPDQPPRVVLAAPTGKAATRITESIRGNLANLACQWTDLNMPTPMEVFPTEAVTLHRLIGMREGRSIPRHNPDNPLHLDVLVIDEASMIDLPLMVRTVSALPEHARLILLGDSYQLASVEPGSVFADLCGRSRSPGYSGEWMSRVQAATGMNVSAEVSQSSDTSPLDDCTVFLRRSYRFDEKSRIGRMATFIRSCPLAGGITKEQLVDAEFFLREEVISDPDIPGALLELVGRYFVPVILSSSPDEALSCLEKFRILCAVREGPRGVVVMNRLVEGILRQEGFIPSNARVGKGRGGNYTGRPVLITQNDYDVGLFNGDLGILWPDESSERLFAWFKQVDGTLKEVHLSRLPPHETAFAMTVHKSQGSEFDHVLFILPDRDVPVLTRELVYTAVTRARKSIKIWGSKHLLYTAISRPTERSSGLYERLFGQAPNG